MRVLTQDQQRQELLKVSLIRHRADEAAHVMSLTGLPRPAVAVFPSDVAAYGSDRFGSLAERLKIHLQHVVAIEMGEGIDAIA
jgi:hypothetical protein